MECKFVVGQRVVSVRERFGGHAMHPSVAADPNRPKFPSGNVYTIRAMRPDPDGIRVGLQFTEAPDYITPDGHYIWWDSRCFEPVHTMEFWLGAKQELKEKA